MDRAALAQRFDEAVAHHNAGRLQQAAALYREVLSHDPRNPVALHMLGILVSEVGRVDEAIALLQAAITIRPDYWLAVSNLSKICTDAGRADDGLRHADRAVAFQPDFAEAHNNRGLALMRLGRLDDAQSAFERVLALDPRHFNATTNLATALYTTGRFEAAAKHYQAALQLDPNSAQIHINLGATLKQLRQLAQARAHLERAIQLNPNESSAYNNLGMTLGDMGETDAAISHFRRAIALKPDYLNALHNLGVALMLKGLPDEAAAQFRRAIALHPDFDSAWGDLAATLLFKGQVHDAVIATKRAVAAQASPQTYSLLLYTLNFLPDADPAEIAAVHSDWRRFASATARRTNHANVRDPDRRLRIGYVSPDFGLQVVGMNILPLLANHDHAAHEIFLYSNSFEHDVITQRIRPHADHWREIAAFDDDAAADLIARDGIDILVDLTLHMTANRMMLFARQPAPVQATFAGYPGTTALPTIQYRITDPHLEPESLERHQWPESPMRLPHSFWCYGPLGDEPSVNDLPAVTQGRITFGCLNNFAKTNPAVLEMWATILSRVANSRFVLLAPLGDHRGNTLKAFEAAGISADRIEFFAHRPRLDYLRLYNRIDLALETFPYNGHTTSLDAAWMGVTTPTVAGALPVARAGVSQLTNLGLTELIAHTRQEYIEMVCALADDLDRLAELRRGMRDRMRHSPITDAVGFAHGVESCYRRMWQTYCGES